MHTDRARDTQTGALRFTAEKKVIQISELTSSQELQTLPTKTNLLKPYSYATAKTTLFEEPTFVSNFIFKNKTFKTFTMCAYFISTVKGR
jgi:hypothetical protein